jgi:molecular chaperone DnaK
MVAIGIDLGTTNSAAAIADQEGGTPRLLSRRAALTPSIVSYMSNVGEPTAVIVGEEALQRAQRPSGHRTAEQTIISVKRLMGRTTNDAEVEQIKRRYAYRIADSGDPGDSGVRVLIGNTPYTPTEISAQILRHIAADAAAALGEAVTHAVITVPAYFSEAQRAATRLAAQQAGLIVKKMIDEPTAAAIAFGLSHRNERHYALVYDLGGGTFDISLVQISDNQFAVLATEGDMWLGGDDFDLAIVAAIAQKISDDEKFDPSDDSSFQLAAKQAAERAKLELSSASTSTITLSVTRSARLVPFQMTLSRQHFEELIEPFIERTLALVRKVLQDRDLVPEDITALLLVGGSTRMPIIQERLIDLFGAETLRDDIDPMLCVAYGAALLAAQLHGVICPHCATENDEQAALCTQCKTPLSNATLMSSIGLGEVTSRSLGIEVVDANGRGDRFAVIIPKSTPYPLQQPMRRTFSIGADDTIMVPVYEGEDALASRNDLQGVIEYRLPKPVALNTPVSISFNFDRDRVLTVVIEVENDDRLRYVTTLTRDRPRLAKEDGNDWLQQVDWVANLGESFLRRYDEFLTDSNKQKLREEIAAARWAYRRRDRIACEEARETIETTLLSSGVATYLYLCACVNERMVIAEGEGMRKAAYGLESAFRRGDQHRVKALKQIIAQYLERIFKRLEAQDSKHSGRTALVRQRS